MRYISLLPKEKILYSKFPVLVGKLEIIKESQSDKPDETEFVSFKFTFLCRSYLS